MYLDTKEKKECSGCSACMNICAHNAIEMEEDPYGFLYPKVDENKCVKCDLCRRVCPFNNTNDNNIFPFRVLGVTIKDEVECQKSTSGGVVYELSRYVIQHGGVVVGAEMSDDFGVSHVCKNTIEGLQSLRGSKYVQSEINLIFQDIKKYLKQGKKCLFVGTGCQVAGLKSYLGKEYDNLITVDLVCHGVPSQKIFKSHIELLMDKYHGKICNYQFRDTVNWDGCESFQVLKGNGRKFSVKKPTYELSPFLYAFMHGLIMRDSCDNCKFAKIPRQGDVTVGDFWGIKDLYPQFPSIHGASVVLVNSEKGENIIKLIENDCYIIESDINKGSYKNPNILHGNILPTNRVSILEDINKYGYRYVANKYFRSPNYMKVYLLSKLMEVGMLKKIILFVHKLRKSHD